MFCQTDGMDGIEIGLHGFGAKLNLRGSNKAQAFCDDGDVIIHAA